MSCKVVGRVFPAAGRQMGEFLVVDPNSGGSMGVGGMVASVGIGPPGDFSGDGAVGER